MHSLLPPSGGELTLTVCDHGFSDHNGGIPQSSFQEGSLTVKYTTTAGTGLGLVIFRRVDGIARRDDAAKLTCAGTTWWWLPPRLNGWRQSVTFFERQEAENRYEPGHTVNGRKFRKLKEDNRMLMSGEIHFADAGRQRWRAETVKIAARRHSAHFRRTFARQTAVERMRSKQDADYEIFRR